MLFNGEKIGDGTPPLTDIAVDPIDGTTLTAQGRGGALAVIAVAERGAMFDPGPCVYMEKLAVGPRAKGACDIRRTPTENLHALSEALGRPVRDLTAVILDRPRHDALIAEVRASRRPHPPHHRRRRRRRHRDRAGPARASTSSSASAAPPRACWPRRPSSAWAPRSRASSTRATRPSARPRSRPATSSTRC